MFLREGARDKSFSFPTTLAARVCVFDYVAILHPQPQPNRVHLMRGGLLLSFCFQNTSHFNLSEFSAGRHGKEGTHWKACPFTDASTVLTESTFSANLNVRQSDSQCIDGRLPKRFAKWRTADSHCFELCPKHLGSNSSCVLLLVILCGVKMIWMKNSFLTRSPFPCQNLT